MDPVEFWSSQMAPKRPSSAASQRQSVRSGSMDRDDPLLTAPQSQFKAPEKNEARQSRIAVVLKSPAYVHRLSSPQVGGRNESENRAASSSAPSSQHAAPSLASRAKKQTPVPLPKPLMRTSAPTTSAAPIRTPVPLPKPLSRTATPAVQPAVPSVVASVVAPAPAFTPVPIPKPLIKTPAPTNNVTIAKATPSIPISAQGPVPVSAAIPAPASQPSAGRGRPKGWKPGMSYASVRGPASVKPTAERSGRPGRPAKPKPPPSGYAKRRGRPPKAPSPLPWEVYGSLQKSFAAFLCEWSGCKAELHNLDTLRRHVSVVHCRKSPLVCRWGKCAENQSLDQFPNMPSLRAHIEKKHLIPFSWHIGDGPQNYGALNQRSKEEEIPDYLKDDQGNQVTPSIHDQELEDFSTWKRNRQKLKDLLVRLNDSLPSEESDSPVYED